MWKSIIAAGLLITGLAGGNVGFNHSLLPKGIDCSYIIHAAGELEGIASSNSLEALENSYKSGNRIIEIDFNFTEELKAVAVHDFNWAVFPEYVDGTVPTYDDFMSTKIYGRFTPMCFDDVAKYMTEHEDLYIVSDVKENSLYFANMIKENYPELMTRFIIQAYSEEEYHKVHELGFDKIIYTLYRLSWKEKTNTKHLIEFAKENPLFAYTFPYELCDIDGYVEQMKKSGVPLFIHTLNDKEKMDKYFKMGINGIYTDNTTHK